VSLFFYISFTVADPESCRSMASTCTGGAEEEVHQRPETSETPEAPKQTPSIKEVKNTHADSFL